MNDNICRHKILKILSERLIETDVAFVNGEKSNVWAMSFKTISEKTGCSELKIRQVVSVLLENKEVFLNTLEFKGLGVEEAGLSAFSTKKYLNTYKSDIINLLKDIVQIFIPIISMTIALIAVSNSDSEKIDKLETRLQEIQVSITNMEENTEKYTNKYQNQNFEFSEKDSLSIK